MKEGFSLERIGMLWDYYSPRIIRQIVATIAVVVMSYFFLVVCCDINSYTMYSLGVNFFLLPLYFSPFVYATYRSRDIFVQLPATVAEKCTFILAHSMILIPAVIALSWLSIQAIGIMTGMSGNVLHHFDSRLREIGVTNSVMNEATIFANFVPLIVSLYVVLSSTSHRILRGIVAFFATLFSLGLLNGLFYGAWIFYKIIPEIKGANNSLPDNLFSEMLRATMPTYIAIYASISFMITVIGMVLICRRIKRMQV